MAAGADDDIAQAYQTVLDDQRAPDGASLCQVFRAAKKRRILAEHFHESGRITDGDLAGAYASESAALEELVAPVKAELYNKRARARNNNKAVDETLLSLKNSSNKLPQPQLQLPTTLNELDKLSLARGN